MSHLEGQVKVSGWAIIRSGDGWEPLTHPAGTGSETLVWRNQEVRNRTTRSLISASPLPVSAELTPERQQVG